MEEEPLSPRESVIGLRPIGVVASPLRDAAVAPRQPDEGAPAARIVLAPEVQEAMDGLTAGMELIVVTWLHRAQRDLLTIRPRGDATREPLGVFATRAPHRPNPIGLHQVRLVSRRGMELEVEALEAIDGTPVLDLKPVLGHVDQR